MIFNILFIVFPHLKKKSSQNTPLLLFSLNVRCFFKYSFFSHKSLTNFRISLICFIAQYTVFLHKSSPYTTLIKEKKSTDYLKIKENNEIYMACCSTRIFIGNFHSKMLKIKTDLNSAIKSIETPFMA